MKKLLSFLFPGAKATKVNLFAQTIFGYLTIGTTEIQNTHPSSFGFYHWTQSPLGTNSISLSSDAMTLTVTMNAKLLAHRQPAKVSCFEGKRSITFEERWEAPAEVNETLKASRPIVIEPGKHKLAYSHDTYIMTISLVPVAEKSSHSFLSWLGGFNTLGTHIRVSKNGLIVHAA